MRRRLGRYQLIQRLGGGGMGEVWDARHDKLARPVAVKLIRPEALGARDERSRTVVLKRFEREAQATAALTSPHTIELYDFGSADDGTFYYAMERLSGLNLDSLVKRFGPVDPARAIAFLDQVCDSLAEAHEHGLIHRDVKPANIYTCRQGTKFDFVKVLDFGLVKLTPVGGGEVTELTEESVAAGTPAFMPPELALANRELDGRADLYALGCVGYWLLSGQLVFEGDSPMQLAMAHVQREPTPLSERSEIEVPPDLEAVLMSCLAKDPDDRPADASVLQERLLACESAGGWNNARAQKWWRVHLPELAEVRPQPTGDIQVVGEPAQTEPGLFAPHTPAMVGAAEGGPDPLADIPAGEPVSETRTYVLRQLRNHFAHSVLDIEEFERRTERAQYAETRAELGAALQGLTPVDTHGRALVRAEGTAPPAVQEEGALVPFEEVEAKRIIAIFGGSSRRGAWQPPRRLKVFAIFGGVVLDFREARMLPGETIVDVTCVMGGLEVIVPPGMPVETEGVGFLGGFEGPASIAISDEAQPRLRVSGFAMFGGVGVQRKDRNGDAPVGGVRRRLREKRRRLLEDRSEDD